MFAKDFWSKVDPLFFPLVLSKKKQRRLLDFSVLTEPESCGRQSISPVKQGYRSNSGSPLFERQIHMGHPASRASPSPGNTKRLGNRLGGSLNFQASCQTVGRCLDGQSLESRFNHSLAYVVQRELTERSVELQPELFEQPHRPGSTAAT